VVGRLANSSSALLVVIVALSPRLAIAQHAEVEHAWSYEGAYGPAKWGDLKSEYTACRTGKHQSPIDIRNAKAADLPALKFSYGPSAYRIVDNGHTVQVNVDPGSFITVGERRYDLVQLHFHHPSEERIHGQAFPMVAHLVHKDADGKLAVVSKAEVATFAAKYPHNARPVQPLNGRTVQATR
jgi:carbonic anhydrase